MGRKTHIPGAALPTAMVASVLLMLTVLGVMAAWEGDFLLFSRHRYDAMQRAHIESGFTLYAEYPDLTLSRLDADGTMLLYDSVAQSRIGIERKRWGLYEVVTVSGYDEGRHVSKIFGLRPPIEGSAVLVYPDDGAPLTLAGETRLRGRVRLPRSGIVYGQMGDEFFGGEPVETASADTSGDRLPEPSVEAFAVVAGLRQLVVSKTIGAGSAGEADPSTGWDYGSGHAAGTDGEVKNGFHGSEPIVIVAGERLDGARIEGNVIVAGDSVSIASSCRLTDVIVAGRKISIEEGFCGSVQVFASDSIFVGANVVLGYPSGLFSGGYAEVGDDSIVNGYVIVDGEGEPDPKSPNYVSSRFAKVRGLVYIDGTAQIQGIVSGVVMLRKAVYYAPGGYYENMLYDATILENPEPAMPLWLEGDSGRKEAKWLN